MNNLPPTMTSNIFTILYSFEIFEEKKTYELCVIYFTYCYFLVLLFLVYALLPSECTVLSQNSVNSGE